jgi:tRNA G37 N-methylase Trm5
VKKPRVKKDLWPAAIKASSDGVVLCYNHVPAREAYVDLERAKKFHEELGRWIAWVEFKKGKN